MVVNEAVALISPFSRDAVEPLFESVAFSFCIVL